MADPTSPRVSRAAAAAPVRGEAPVLELRDLRVVRGGGSDVRLTELRLEPGETAALVGPSGCGKTTLLLGWSGLLPGVRVTGQRRVLGAEWPAADTPEWSAMLAQPVTILLQDAKAALDPLQRVGVQIGAVTRSTAEARRLALRELGLTDPDRILRSHPHELSGGQAQKVLLAIASLRAPRLLIADEPTAALDGDSIAGFVAGLRVLRERHRVAVWLATHDQELVEAVGARVLRHRDGVFLPAELEPASWPAGEPLPASGVVLRAVGIDKSYGAVPVLRDVSLAILGGEIVAVVGPSGCGKSTLARILTGHLAPDRGTVTGGAGDPVGSRRGRVRPVRERQLLFQDAFASLTPHRTIRSLLDETRVPGFDPEAEARAIGLPVDRLSRRAGELSGGERRRAALLRALSVEPSLLVLDEPTASLDHEAARSVMELIVGVQRRRRLACVLVTHDAAMARAYAHRVLELREGRLG